MVAAGYEGRRAVTGGYILPDMSEEARAFLPELWEGVRDDVLSTWRDAIKLLNILVILAAIKFAFFLGGLAHLDEDLLTTLNNLHKWTTVLVFGSLCVTVVLRSIVAVVDSVKRKDNA